MSDNIIAIIVAIFASGGFWAFLQNWISSRFANKSAEQKLILGLAFRQIIELCEYYLNRGWIDTEEYKELNQYLFKPYQDLGGDGTAQRLIKEVERLPLRKEAKDNEH